MYEHKSQHLLPKKLFYKRVLSNVLIALMILLVSLMIGEIGAAKLFSSFYALFSGIVFIANIGVILAPLMHRIYHHLHLEDNATS